jgi:hypothetical protein
MQMRDCRGDRRHSCPYSCPHFRQQKRGHRRLDGEPTTWQRRASFWSCECTSQPSDRPFAPSRVAQHPETPSVGRCCSRAILSSVLASSAEERMCAIGEWEEQDDSPAETCFHFRTGTTNVVPWLVVSESVTRTALSRPLLTAAPRQEEQRRRRRMAEARPLLFRERRSGLLASCSRHARRPDRAVGTRTVARRQPQSTAGGSKVSAARCAGAGLRWRVGSAQPERRSGHDAVRLPRHRVDLVRVPRVVVSDGPELRSVELGHPVTLGPRFVPALVERS